MDRAVAVAIFTEAVFENWESEFLQMAAFVLLTVGLHSVGTLVVLAVFLRERGLTRVEARCFARFRDRWLKKQSDLS